MSGQQAGIRVHGIRRNANSGRACDRFTGWNAIKVTKQQVLDLVNQNFAKIRCQVHASMKSLDRVQDQLLDNREDIFKIKVNIACVQYELGSMSRTLDAFVGVQ